MVTGPAAFENFKRLMQRFLAVPKEEAAARKAKSAKKRKPLGRGIKRSEP